MSTEQRRRITDVRVMRALANPVRYRILGHLMAAGPQTASECAAVVDATPSNCSYHLRELARYGLVERTDGPVADGRERPWRTTATGFSFQPADDGAADPVATEASRRLIHLGIDDEAALAHAAADAHDGLPEPWRAAGTMATYGLQLAPDELVALTAAVDALIRPWIGLTREDAPPEARVVHVTFRAFRLPGDE
jgi:DNA-binding transcriptional ArsR family regulator